MALLGRLQAASASDTPASLLAAHMTLSCAGRLCSASPAGIVVEIGNPPHLRVTLLGRTAAVTFPAGGGVVAFASVVTALDLRPDGALRVTLAVPERLQDHDRRAAVRIAVPRGSMATTIVDGSRRHAVRPVDVSLTGILIEVDGVPPPMCAVGQTFTLAITRGADEIVVQTEVCRRDGARFGLRFLPVDQPPKGMARLIYDIQEVRRPGR